MPSLKLYDKLIELPFFQGMSQSDLADIVAHTRLGFLKYARNKTVVKEGDACLYLMFLIQGKLIVEGKADDNSYTISEQMTAPDMLQPERIFGLTQRYTHTFSTLTECHFIRLDKAEVLRLAEHYEIFRLNLLNIISTQSQKLARLPWQSRPKTVRDKIVRFVSTHCLRPAGGKRVIMKMEDLAQHIGESRLNVSRTLNAMHAEGSIELGRSNFHIPALEQLLM